jgi:hypothetical protein
MRGSPSAISRWAMCRPMLAQPSIAQILSGQARTLVAPMLVPPDIVEPRSPGLRLWRAWEQIQVLESHIARWMNSGG